MSKASDRLFNLLPMFDRLRDAEQVGPGQTGPLQELLNIIAEQVINVEDDIGRLYDNWFIETAQEWAVPYIGELIGYTSPALGGEIAASATGGGLQAGEALLVPRGDVAHTLGYRRRKGTLALLQALAHDVAGWQALAVEFYRLLGVAVNLNHQHPRRGRTVDLRHGDALDRIGEPFDEIARTIDVRRVDSVLTRGRYNIPSVALFVWRLGVYPITNAPAYCVDRTRHNYTFNVLGIDTQLFTDPLAEPPGMPRVDEVSVPAPIRRHAFADRTADYYGVNRSLLIYRDNETQAVPLDHIVPADLSNWTYRAEGDQVAVDPVLGRIAFSPKTAPRNGVWVTYHYGFSTAMGGGEYLRPVHPPFIHSVSAQDPDTGQTTTRQVGQPVYRVGEQETLKQINDALDAWKKDKTADPACRDAIIEITDSQAYQEQLHIELEEGDRLELRAAQGVRPVLRLLNWRANQPDALRVSGLPPEPTGEEGEELREEQWTPAAGIPCAPGQRLPRLVLDGLMIVGRSLQISDRLASVTIRHCTLVPGWSLDEDSEPQHAEEPNIELFDTQTRLIVEHSILGSIEVNVDDDVQDPVAIDISDSILDATAPDLPAIDGPECPVAHVVLTIARTTVIGTIKVNSVELAENSIFIGRVEVQRRQSGCMRFCYVPPHSPTPRRYHCQPETAVGSLTGRDRELVQDRVTPRFNSLRYGSFAYCQLADGCADEIKTGADDNSEMGVFHDLFQPQREANLRARLEEYAPAGMDAGIIFVS